MELGNTITQRRKALGLTQAQVAEYLGVTTPAVNKWEKNLSCPDISLLAPLARLLGIDMNELFAFHERLSAEEIEKITDDYVKKAMGKLRSPDKYDFAIKFIDDNMKAYPTDAELIRSVVGISGIVITGKDGEESFPLLRKMIEADERLLEIDPERENELHYSLMDLYGRIGDYESAEYHWDCLQETKLDKKWIRGELLYRKKQYAEASMVMKKSILLKITDLLLNLTELHDSLYFEGKEDEAKLALQKRKELQEMFGIWDMVTVSADHMSGKDTGNTGKASGMLRSLLGLLIHPKDIQYSKCPLFAGVDLDDEGEESIGGLLQDISEVIRKK